MKHLHFFGCSFTAGDELSDDIWFPWKHECKDQDEYYTRRHEILCNMEDNIQYQLDNKARAYPAKIENEEYKTYNHAKNGESLRRNIFLILQLIYSKSTAYDAIFLQIPPVGRELYIDSDLGITSLSFRGIDSYLDLQKKYLQAKAMSHRILQYSVEDLIDLLMLSNLCKQKNIRFYLIDFHQMLKPRLDDLRMDTTKDTTKFQFISDNIFEETNIINFDEIVLSVFAENKILLGGHFPEESHQKMADKIKKKLPEIFNLQA